jgi:hypothetical protein
VSGEVSARRGERGQSLLFALLALLIASMAAAFVAQDLMLRERAMQEEAARLHVRALLDGALADALARLADGRSIEPRLSWGDGRADVEKIEGEPVPEGQAILRVYATYAARRGAIEAHVLMSPVTVLSWRRIPPSN